MQTCRNRWKPTATSAPQHRRSSSATLAGSRNTRSPSVCHSQQLAGCCLPNASSGLRARHLAMQFGRDGCALGRPRQDQPRGVSFVTCCGVHGLTHRLNHPNHRLSHGDAPSFLLDCRCLGCDPSVTSTYARARALSNHSLRARGLSKALWSWLGFRRVTDFDRTHKAARSPETAGLGTSISARSRKKSRGGKKS